jgi:hypothetical protein
MTAGSSWRSARFDDPGVAAPEIQVNPSDKLPFVDGIPGLPMRAPGSEPRQEEFRNRVISHQHPDHDTEAWPPHSGVNDIMKERLYLFDTTLRDGAQTAGVDFSLEDKIARSAGMLEELGLDYIEGGYPGANPTDTHSSPNRARAGRPSPPSA